jgi:hypothetical protein
MVGAATNTQRLCVEIADYSVTDTVASLLD